MSDHHIADESGWGWFIPLQDGVVSVDDIMAVCLDGGGGGGGGVGGGEGLEDGRIPLDLGGQMRRSREVVSVDDIGSGSSTTGGNVRLWMGNVG